MSRRGWFGKIGKAAGIAIALIGVAAFVQDQFLQAKERSQFWRGKRDQLHSYRGIYEQYAKRPLDAMLAGLGILLLWPVLLGTGILVKLKLGSPVLFRQDRPGKDTKIFQLYKFRTMTDEKDENGELLPDEARLTPFGKALRSTSLDELPELFNILKGDMAIVGPRPLLVRYLPRYNAKQARRHEVRPGLTGLAQAHGRNAISWEQKFDYDVQYVDNITLAGDVSILADTVKEVINKEGVSEAGEATMEEFMGAQS